MQEGLLGPTLQKPAPDQEAQACPPTRTGTVFFLSVIPVLAEDWPKTHLS